VSGSLRAVGSGDSSGLTLSEGLSGGLGVNLGIGVLILSPGVVVAIVVFVVMLRFLGIIRLARLVRILVILLVILLVSTLVRVTAFRFVLVQSSGGAKLMLKNFLMLADLLLLLQLLLFGAFVLLIDLNVLLKVSFLGGNLALKFLNLFLKFMNLLMGGIFIGLLVVIELLDVSFELVSTLAGGLAGIDLLEEDAVHGGGQDQTQSDLLEHCL